MDHTVGDCSESIVLQIYEAQSMMLCHFNYQEAVVSCFVRYSVLTVTSSRVLDIFTIDDGMNLGVDIFLIRCSNSSNLFR